MSRQTFDNSYGHNRRVPAQSYYSGQSSSRNNATHSSRNSTSQSTVQPHRQTNTMYLPSHPYYQYDNENLCYDEYPTSALNSSSNYLNNAYDDQSYQGYQSEVPSMYSSVHQPHIRHVDHQTPPYPHNYYDSNDHRSSTNYHSVSPSIPTERTHPRNERNSNHQNRRQQREATHSLQSYPRNVNYQPPNASFELQRSHPDRSANLSSVVSRDLPINGSSDPTSVLNQVLESFFGEPTRPRRNINVVRSTIDPISLFAAVLMNGRPEAFSAPGALHIHFGDLFDLLPRGEPPSIGLTEDDIKRLPTTIYRKTHRSSASDDKCTICLSEYKNGETIKHLRCKHFFHAECIDPWLQTSTQCPICRGPQNR